MCVCVCGDGEGGLHLVIFCSEEVEGFPVPAVLQLAPVLLPNVGDEGGDILLNPKMQKPKNPETQKPKNPIPETLYPKL